jgi:hypothetical protein
MSANANVADTATLLAAIRTAAESRAKADALAAITALGGASFAGVAVVGAELALKDLNGQRWFDLGELLGAILIAAYPDARGIRRRYGQALVERNKTQAARDQAERLLAAPDVPLDQQEDLYGLIGRTYKQEFVASLERGQRDDAALFRAIDAYLAGYDKSPAHTYCGINAVALLELAKRKGLACEPMAGAPTPRDPQVEAAKIIDTLSLAEGLKHWDLATLAEANVARGRWDEARKHLLEYLWYPKANAFSFGSTLRQFEEVWRFDDPASPGGSLVTLLRARLIEMENGSVRLTPADVLATLKAGGLHFEKVFGKDHFTSFETYQLGLKRCAAVAQIGFGVAKGEGSGFVIRGSALADALGSEVVLVTNAHVIDPTGENEGIAPDDAVVSFKASEKIDPNAAFTVKHVLWSSTRKELDVTIARLDREVPLDDSYPVVSQRPLAGARVIAVGHPGGGTLSLSLNDNEVIGIEKNGCRLHYRTPTEGGSSGCPLFTASNWKLVGIHHASDDNMPKLNGEPGTYQANEGIWIQSIREALAAARFTA